MGDYDQLRREAPRHGTKAAEGQDFSAARKSMEKYLRTISKQYVILSDTGGTGHTWFDKQPDEKPVNSLSFLADTKTAEMLKRQGFENLALEERHEFQPLIDKVTEGKMSPGEYARGVADIWTKDSLGKDLVRKLSPGVFEKMRPPPTQRDLLQGQITQSMATQGIRVICAEEQAPNLREHAITAFNFQIAAARWLSVSLPEAPNSKDTSAQLPSIASWPRDPETAVTMYLTAQAHVDQFRGALKEEADIQGHRGTDPKAPSTGETYRQLVEARIRGDHNLARTIKEKSGGKKTIVHYGFGHGATQCDLNEYLDNAPRVELHATAVDLKAHLQGAYMNKMQLPDAAIAFDTGEIFTKKDYDKFLVKNVPRLPDQYVPNTCPIKP